jgi:hypothetical protein
MTDPRVEEAEVSPSILEELHRKVHELVRGMMADRLRASAERALDWTFRRVLTYLTAAAFFVTAAVFALLAGMEGLKQAGAPPWAAHLALGLGGALAGAMLLHGIRNRELR